MCVYKAALFCHLTGAEFGSDVPNITGLINLENFHKNY